MIDKQRLRTFVLGGAVGALVGILLTPRTGREVRGSISDRVGEARDRGREGYFETQERLRERLAEMGESETLRSVDTEEATVGSEVGPGGEPPFAGPGGIRLRGLRDVSLDTQEHSGQTGDQPAVDRSEELRRKVRETRDRLRRRTEGPGGQA